ncbi:MAG: LmeA family phospholipid-binding protein, partial [Cyanobacteria bacterium Co-bin8]|nr:LmeA family phospholipid-binding protein [Cyanobacteria bacterium Co-bin8]
MVNEEPVENTMAVDQLGEASQRGGSRVISRILPPAVRLLIQTQVDQVENLVFQIEGRDRQILSGYVPKAAIAADRAVYQGLHLSHVQVEALEIRINLGQVMRGKPLRLLQRFPIVGKVVIQEHDLAASLAAPLLRDGIRDFLQQLMAVQRPGQDLRPYLGGLLQGDQAQFRVGEVAIAPKQLTLTLLPIQGAAAAVTLQTGLAVREGHILILHEPSLRTTAGSEP